MGIEDRVRQLRVDRLASGSRAVPEALQGVSRARILEVMTRLGFGKANDLVDVVYALLDDRTPSWFSKAPQGTPLSAGATTAHIACHVGILQRGGNKLDREGRDYWIKPLAELGIVEPVTFTQGQFLEGHVIAKSSGTSYRLDPSFVTLLQSPEAALPGILQQWSSADAARQRRELHAAAAEASRALVDNKHSGLIQASVEVYAAHFHPGFEVIYIDDGDGDRISTAQRAQLSRAGITLELGDAMPDALLWHPDTDQLWVIEAVTSDGEVDFHKVNRLRELARRSGKAGIGFTTTYRSWKDAAARQDAHQNLAVGSYLWVLTDPGRRLRVEAPGA